MGLTVKETGGNFSPAPEGTHVAICTQVIDLGTQYSKFYEKSAEKVLLGWELPNRRDEEKNEPFLVWKRYTASLNEKATLRAHLKSWRGRDFTEDELKEFNLRNILGAACLLSIVHQKAEKGTAVYANVAAIMSLPSGTAKPPQFHPSILFDIEKWDQAVFETFSDNLKKTIMESDEVKALNRSTQNLSPDNHAPQANDTYDPDQPDEVPF